MDKGLLLKLWVVFTSQSDALAQFSRYIVGRRVPTLTRVGNVVLHTRLWVKLELPRIQGSSQSLIYLLGVVWIALRVVNMLHVSITSQPFARHLKLVCSKAELEK